MIYNKITIDEETVTFRMVILLHQIGSANCGMKFFIRIGDNP